MNVFDFDNVKYEIKPNAMLRYDLLQTIKKLFRSLELCFLLVLFLWTSPRLPFAVKLSGEYFRQLTSLVLSPLFIFLVCNVIVLTLLLKSAGQSPVVEKKTADLYQEFISQSVSVSETILQVNAVDTSTPDVKVTCRRSQSENFTSHGLNLHKNLSSSENFRPEEAEKSWKMEDRDEEEEEEAAADADDVLGALSNEEFRRAIEAFIAKQVKFHQQEKLAIVLRSQA